MTLDRPKRSDFATIERRRELVASLVVRRLSVREITDALAKQGQRNPATEAPWSRETVHQDIKALETDWRRRYRQAIDDHKARHLAQLQAVERQGWMDRDMGIVLASLKQQAEVLGLNKPAQVDITVYVRQMATELGLDPEEAVREAERVIRAAR